MKHHQKATTNKDRFAMKCEWCNGTYKECGCGYGHCAHCKDGEQTPYPFEIFEIRNVISSDAVSAFANCYSGMSNRVDFVKAIANLWKFPINVEITEHEIQIFIDYWHSPHHNSTLGDWIKLIAQYMEDVVKPRTPTKIKKSKWSRNEIT